MNLIDKVYSFHGKSESELDEYFGGQKTEGEVAADRRTESDKQYEDFAKIYFGLKYYQAAKQNKTGPAKSTSKTQATANNGVNSKGTSLNWTAVVPKKGKYVGQSREEHVRLHNVDNKTKPLHGVFNGDGVAITNDAWAKAQSLGLKPDAQGTLVVPFPNAGISGGANGNGSTLNNVTIHVVPNTNNIITSYPSN